MYSIFSRLLLLAFLGTLSISTALAQAPLDGFFKGKGNLQIATGVGVESAPNYIAGDGLLALPTTLIYTGANVAYGISDRFDASLSIPFILVNSEAGLQDGRLNLKYRLFEAAVGKNTLSVQLAAAISTPLSDYDTERSISIGQQATSIEARPIVHYQRTDGWFATAQYFIAGKSNPTPDARGGNFKIGKAMSKDYFDVWFDLLDSTGEFNYRGQPSASTFRALSPDIRRVGATYYHRFKDGLGGYAGFAHTLGGINVRLATGISLGVVFDL